MAPPIVAPARAKPVRRIALPLEISKGRPAPVHAPGPQKTPALPPKIPRPTYILLGIAVDAGTHSGWAPHFADQERHPIASFMESWHRALGAPDAAQAAPPIRAWRRWSRFRANMKEVREVPLCAPTANALAVFLAEASRGGHTAAASVHSSLARLVWWLRLELSLADSLVTG